MQWFTTVVLAAVAVYHAGSAQTERTEKSNNQTTMTESTGIVSTLFGHMKQTPCKLHANFYPSGQWRLSRGFAVDAGNSLSSAQTHYQPRVFLDCTDDNSNSSSSVHVAPGTVASLLLISLPTSHTVKNYSDPSDVLSDGWLHWFVADFPLNCDASGCREMITDTPGTPLQTDKGTNVAGYVPPGVAELAPPEEADNSPPSLYVFAVFVNAGDLSSLKAVTPIDQSVVSSKVRSNMMRRLRSGMENTIQVGRLLGLNFFRGVVDNIGSLQFIDIKDANHGIVHSSRAKANKDEL